MTEYRCICGCEKFMYLGKQGDGNGVDRDGNVTVFDLGKCEDCGSSRKISDYYKANIHEEK